MSTQTLAVDETRLHELAMKMVGDLGAAASGALVITGDKLGLYDALDERGPVTAAELADATGTHERYVREWLANQAASGYVSYDDTTGRFFLSPEQRMIFVDRQSPLLMTGGFSAAATLYHDEAKLADAFRTGEGISWGDHHSCLFCGTERFFRPSYQANLVDAWIPALDGVQEKLERGATVADVGCGHGASTMILAAAFPASTFVGYDPHEPSVLVARAMARERGLTNVTFEVGTAQDFPASGWDLVCMFDALHDMGDPAGAARRVREVLADDGTWMIVEPMAGDRLEDNLNPVGRVYYAFSTGVCTPNALSQPGRRALGAQAGEAALADVAREGGFGSCRRAAATPFNLVLEARP